MDTGGYGKMVVMVDLAKARGLTRPCPHIPKILAGSNGCAACQYHVGSVIEKTGEGVWEIEVHCSHPDGIAEKSL